MPTTTTTTARLKAAIAKSVRQRGIVRCHVTIRDNGLRALSEIADVEGHVETDDAHSWGQPILAVWGRTWAGECFRLHLIGS